MATRQILDADRVDMQKALELEQLESLIAESERKFEKDPNLK